MKRIHGSVLAPAALAALFLTGCSAPASIGGSPSTVARATREGTDPPGPVTAGPVVSPSAAARPADPRASLPTVTVAPVAALSYAAVPAKIEAPLAAVATRSAGILVSSSFSSVLSGGRPVGTVGTYVTKPGLARSTVFQDQYLVQLIDAVAGKRPEPRFVRLDGRVVALSSGAPAVAGWFEADRVLLLLRAGTSPELAALAQGVMRTPPAT
jgi:hypothetical protein